MQVGSTSQLHYIKTVIGRFCNIINEHHDKIFCGIFIKAIFIARFLVLAYLPSALQMDKLKPKIHAMNPQKNFLKRVHPFCDPDTLY